MYVAEILPDIGIALVILSNWIEVLIIGFLFPIVADPEVIGAGWTFLFFACISFSGIIFIMFFVKETKGKSLPEIEALFNTNKQLKSKY